MTSVDVSCAREERLSVIVPAEELEKARSEGLTVLVLDYDGYQLPVHIPANYVEGFARSVGYKQSPGNRNEPPRYRPDDGQPYHGDDPRNPPLTNGAQKGGSTAPGYYPQQ